MNLLRMSSDLGGARLSAAVQVAEHDSRHLTR
jgi:hypothetical protein